MLIIGKVTCCPVERDPKLDDEVLRSLCSLHSLRSLQSGPYRSILQVQQSWNIRISYRGELDRGRYGVFDTNRRDLTNAWGLYRNVGT